MCTRYVFLVGFLAALLSLVVPVNVSANPNCQTWDEVVRVRIADLQTGEVLDFAATNYFLNGSQSSSIHFTAANDAGPFANSPNIAMSGSPHDRVWLDANLISGHIDTTIDIYNMQANTWHVVEMRLHTHAPVASYPYVYDANTGEYIRATSEVRGYLMIDGQMWYDLDDAGDLQLLAWNISTCAPRTPR